MKNCTLIVYKDNVSHLISGLTYFQALL